MSLTTPTAVATDLALMMALGMAATMALGCQLSIEGAACPCGPGWSCREAEGSEEQSECVRPYCVFWTYEQRPGGIDIELPGKLVVVTDYVSSVPPGSDILVSGGGTLDIGSSNHRIFVEAFGMVLDVGDDNEIYLRQNAVFIARRGERNVVIHEPGAALPSELAGVVLEEQPAIDFVGMVEAPFATTFRDISDQQIDEEQGGIDDYVVRSSGVLSFPLARADNIFVERQGVVFSLDFSSVAYLQDRALFNAGGKRHVIHYVTGANVENGDNSVQIPHASIELGLCTL
jgi:hypothetical protein